VLCDVCGRNNADTLTFCQDCGRRLRAQRGVAPTPPNGMPKVELPAAPANAAPANAATANAAPANAAPANAAPAAVVAPAAAIEPVPDSGRGSSPSGPASAGRRARPAAPVFSFAPVDAAPDARRPEPPRPAPAEPPRPRAEPVYEGAAKPAAARSPSTCPECRAVNPPEYRFCVTCGTPLRRPASDRPIPGAPPPQASAAFIPQASLPPLPVASSTNGAADHQPSAQGTSEGHDKIIGAPVVDIASGGSQPARFVTCSRCRGQSVSGTRFCKYCGNSLEEPAASGRKPLPPPEPNQEAPTLVRAQSPATQPMTLPASPDAGGNAKPRPAAQPPRPAADPIGRAQVAPQPRALPPVPPASPQPAAAKQPVFEGAAASPKPAAPIYEGAAAPPRPRAAEAPRAGAAVKPMGVPTAPVVHDPETGARSEISELAGSPIPPEPVNLPPRPAPPLPQGRWRGGRLVVIVEDGSEGKSFSLAEGQLDIGRTDGDIILEDDPYVSPRHARLRRLDGSWVLRDLDSTNHVYVRLRRTHALKDGDLLLLGLEVLQFQTVSDGERGLGHAIQHGTFLFGSPATPRRARLCQRTVEGVIRDVYHVFRDETVIGREVGDIVFTADPFLSRRHAVIRRNAVTSEFSLVDLDSSNGTYVAIRGEVGIADGDFLRIGQHLFRVDLG
jgi:pSer/pThr/pTyr-binding forkhead associated (FHA) protein